MTAYLSRKRALGKFYLFLIACNFLIFLYFPAMSIFGEEVEDERPVRGGIFRIKSLADSFRIQLDPVQSDSFIFISEQLYDGLVRLDKNLKIVPSLADYWMISSDGKKYTFFLKKGVRFHHGEEITATDVKFSLERLLDAEVDSPFSHYFISRIVGAAGFHEGIATEVSGIRAIDRYTMEIHWIRPYVPALYILSMPFCKILPRERILQQENKFFLKPSGTGPFKFDFWVRDNLLNEVGVRLIRNEGYYQKKPYLDALEFCPLYTLDHFVNGEIDCIPMLSERLRQPKYQIFHDGSLQTVFLGMSCSIPPLDDPVVRRAIHAGIDKKAVIDAVQEVRYLREVTNKFIPSRIPGFFTVDESSSFDREEATRLLEQAGYGGEREFPRLVLHMESPRTDFKHKFAREIRNQLETLGIEVNVNYFRSLDEVMESTTPYLILVQKMMRIPDPEDMIRPLFSSTSDSQLFGYKKFKIEDLLQSADVERSWSKRIKIFQQIEKILREDIPAIPLYSQQNRVAMQSRVRGVAVPQLGMYYLDTRKIWLER
ncbi:MAG: ABC transporter substrate-binding protein [Candidatus Aminicenantes bacterium]|nr:MAG: ABC transporter substrate-binding protein [Candidatus Aminicenantes bacterium]